MAGHRESRRARVVALVLIAFLVAACAGSDSPSVDTTTTSAKRSTTTAGKAKARSGDMMQTKGEAVEFSGTERLAAISGEEEADSRVGRNAGTNSCSDGWITTAVSEYTGVPAASIAGKPCDPYLYGNARWSDLPDLKRKVAERFTKHCADKWVTLAVMRVFERVPQPHDCNVNLYNNGRWSRWEELLAHVQGTKDNDTARPPDVTWKALVLVYQNVDYPATRAANGTSIAKTPFKASPMTTAQYDDVKASALAFPDAARALSGGRAKVTVRVEPLITRTLNSLSPVPLGDTQVWIDPSDVRTELDQYAAEGTYDSIFVVARNDAVSSSGAVTFGPKMWGISDSTMGLAWGRSVGTQAERFQDGTNGAGYAMILVPPNGKKLGTDASTTNRTQYEKGYSVFLHEWLHQVEMTYESYIPAWARDHLAGCSSQPHSLHCNPSSLPSGTAPNPRPPSPYAMTQPYGYDAWYQRFTQGLEPKNSLQAFMFLRGGARTLR